MSTEPDSGWGERTTPGNQVDLISLPEATINADWKLEGRYYRDAAHKMGQFQKYLSAIRLRIDELRAEGRAVANVEVRLHYISDGAPSPATINYMESQLKQSGLPNVTVYWHRLA